VARQAPRQTDGLIASAALENNGLHAAEATETVGVVVRPFVWWVEFMCRARRRRRARRNGNQRGPHTTDDGLVASAALENNGLHAAEATETVGVVVRPFVWWVEFMCRARRRRRAKLCGHMDGEEDRR
jgi:hypothetical protein